MAVKLGEMLIKANLLTQKKLQEALEYQKANGGKLGFNLVKLGSSRKRRSRGSSRSSTACPRSTCARWTERGVVKLIPSEVAQKYLILPISRTGATLTVAMVDPTNVFAMDDIKFMTGYNVEPVVASEVAIKEAIDRYYGSIHALELKKVMDEMAETDDPAALEVLEDTEDVDLAKLEASSEEAPVVRLVNLILTDSIKRGASDIHVEPYEKDFRVRFRIDGVLYEIMNPPMKLKDAMTSRLKIMAKLDISEKRPAAGRPHQDQDQAPGQGKEMDYRVSVLPTLFGEKIVLRLLDKENLMLDMTRLGFEAESLTKFEKAIFKPYGMVLVTGPTGSGKTNTLYSSISRVNTPETNIITAEDPVEFNLTGSTRCR
jgi:type IV pilus assembly protein PilB